jgi:acetyl-CoA carboxylase beta subunit
VAVDAVVAVGRCQVAIFEGFVVAVEFAFDPCDLGAAAGECFFELRSLALGLNTSATPPSTNIRHGR